ncbi:MAG: helix-turn-helix domain-containing protein [Thermoleophilaceae bacterium]|nr:helix-turn-helix domain-containing protein [Thermoleophilaceae bacterium]
MESFAAVSEAVESGAGLPELARAAGRALDASVAVVDESSAVLAVACASPADERAVLAVERGVEVLELRVADARVGELRYRLRGEQPPAALLRMVATVIALEVERSRGPERASEAAVAAFLSDLLGRRVTDRENILARAMELGTDLSGGASVIVARVHPLQPTDGDWRARALAVAERGARAVERTSLAASVQLGAQAQKAAGGEGELVIVVPGADPELSRRACDAVLRELRAGMQGFSAVVARSRPAGDPVDVHRAGYEALLAANVAEARGTESLAFEESGSYRLLLPVMIDDPAELRRFHEETIAPLVAYDEQYETELVRTLETYLDEDGNVGQTAERLFTHRHTVRYRLERVRDLTGLDVGSTEGRERLGLGLKAMRVLGILPEHGPASERGAEAGRVPLGEQDR